MALALFTRSLLGLARSPLSLALLLSEARRLRAGLERRGRERVHPRRRGDVRHQLVEILRGHTLVARQKPRVERLYVVVLDRERERELHRVRSAHHEEASRHGDARGLDVHRDRRVGRTLASGDAEAGDAERLEHGRQRVPLRSLGRVDHADDELPHRRRHRKLGWNSLAAAACSEQESDGEDDERERAEPTENPAEMRAFRWFWILRSSILGRSD
jgi:hypothetical protein